MLRVWTPPNAFCNKLKMAFHRCVTIQVFHGTRGPFCSNMVFPTGFSIPVTQLRGVLLFEFVDVDKNSFRVSNFARAAIHMSI